MTTDLHNNLLMISKLINLMNQLINISILNYLSAALTGTVLFSTIILWVLATFEI